MCKETKSVDVACDNCCEDTTVELDIHLLPEACPVCGSPDIEIKPIGEPE